MHLRRIECGVLRSGGVDVGRRLPTRTSLVGVPKNMPTRDYLASGGAGGQGARIHWTKLDTTAGSRRQTVRASGTGKSMSFTPFGFCPPPNRSVPLGLSGCGSSLLCSEAEPWDLLPAVVSLPSVSCEPKHTVSKYATNDNSRGQTG